MSCKNYKLSTEQALRRLQVLGMDNNDVCIRKEISYMEQALLGKEKLLDREEKLHNWTIYTKLMLATNIKNFEPNNELALEIAYIWKNIIEYTFSCGNFNQALYNDAFETSFHIKPKGDRLINFVHYYPLSLVSGIINNKTEEQLIDYVLNYPKGIYYIYEKQLSKLPVNFNSIEASRYLTAIELLSNYECATKIIGFVKVWLFNNLQKDGFWDMGLSIKDNLQYPLSNSWRKSLNRKIDCTVRIMKLLKKLK